jgi:Dolichyl-phosphate-mannose-protein mannosyltransferase
MNGLTCRRWWGLCALVLTGTLAATIPTTGDIGLTWDEPAYRYSQILSEQWWEQWGQVRSWADAKALLDPVTLLYYWPYARYGINFHPPLAGQLNLISYELLGSCMKDIPARRMASVLEFSLTITILFGFLSNRYGPWVGLVAGASLLLMPRVYGDGHLAGTDTPELLLWAATAVAFWKGLHDPHARRWRVLVGVLCGLAFVEKMGAVLVLAPLSVWLVLGHLPRALIRRDGWADWVDGLLTGATQTLPLALAYREILLLARHFPRPSETNLFLPGPECDLPGVILLAPLAVWAVRELLRRSYRSSVIWGTERPALETLSAILGFAPAVGWLGNPAWWRESLPRLAHYYALNSGRRDALPDIQILYWGQTYEYSLPWHNAWMLIAITVPAGILVAATVGITYAIRRIGNDRIPFYFLTHLMTLPVMRMLPTPAHDGVRLFLPTFFFLAAFAGWGLDWLAVGLAHITRTSAVAFRIILALVMLAPAAWALVGVHPFELSYYNELIGGPAGAWRSGFELTYWYDAFNDQTLAELNDRLPKDVEVAFSNDLSEPMMLFPDLQSLGKLRRDIRILPSDARWRPSAPGNSSSDGFPYEWLLTHDSKASAFTRLLFAMHPWYELRPHQLNGLRVATVADPVAVSRAWALQLLLDAPDLEPPGAPASPAWVREHVPWLGRLWGDGVAKVHRLCINESIFDWARIDPDGLRREAQAIAEVGGVDYLGAQRLRSELMRGDQKRRHSDILLQARPEALREAVEILISRPDALRTALLRYSFTDPASIGGYLDRDLPHGE